MLAPNDAEASAAPAGMEDPVCRTILLMDKWHALVATQRTIYARLRGAAEGANALALRTEILALAPVGTIKALIDALESAPGDAPLVAVAPLHENQLAHDLAKFAHCVELRAACEGEVAPHVRALQRVLKNGRFATNADRAALVAQARATLPPRDEHFCDCVSTVVSSAERVVADVWHVAVDVLPVPTDRQRTLTWFLRHGYGTPLPYEFPLWLGSAVCAHHKKKQFAAQILRVTRLDSLTTVGMLKEARQELIAQYAVNLAQWRARKALLDSFVDRSLPALEASGLAIQVVDDWLPLAHVGDDFCGACRLPIGMDTTGATTCAFCPPPAAPDPMDVDMGDTVIPPPEFLSQ